jgi:hypothetical protein
MSSSLEVLENSHRYVYFLKEASVQEGREGLRDRGRQKAIKSDDKSTEGRGKLFGCRKKYQWVGTLPSEKLLFNYSSRKNEGVFNFSRTIP